MELAEIGRRFMITKTADGAMERHAGTDQHAIHHKGGCFDYFELEN